MTGQPSVRLLLLDPTGSVRSQLDQLIQHRKLSYTVETAASAREAIQQLRRLECDAVLLDCTAEQPEVLNVLDETKDKAVILLVDHRSGETAIRAIRRGACPCLIDATDEKSWSMLPVALEHVIACQRNLAGLRNSAQRYRSLVQTAAVGIGEIDTEGVITFANSAACRMLGYPDGALVGRPIWSLAPSADEVPKVRKYVEAQLTDQPDPTSYFARASTTTGPVIDVRVDWDYQRDESGEVCGVALVVTDITQQRRAEEQAQRHLDQLAHVARVSTMSQMVSGLAHELNQPLGAIANFAYLCRHRARNLQGEHRDEVIEAIGQIAEQADRAGQIIRRLRGFVRREEPHRLAVDVNQLIRDVLALLEIEARLHGVRLQTVLDPALPEVIADRIQIEQVVTNLVHNAMEATCEVAQAQRVVTVRTSSRTMGEVEVAVEDTGKGIAVDQIDRMFEPFYTTKQSGMGLGLSISRSIIEAHGGCLDAAPKEDQGTIFRFTLPAEAGGGNR